MSRENARFLTALLLILGILIMVFSVYRESLRYIGAAVVFSCLIPEFLFNKCPHCGRYLGKNSGRFCQFCGKPLKKISPS